MGTTWNPDPWAAPVVDHTVTMPASNGYCHVASRSGAGQTHVLGMLMRHPDIRAHFGLNLATNLAAWLRSTSVEIGNGVWNEGRTWKAHELRAMVDGFRATEAPATAWVDVSCMYYAAPRLLEVVFPGATVAITLRHHLDRARVHLAKFDLLNDANTEDERYGVWLHYAVYYGLVGDSVLLRELPDAVLINYDQQATEDGYVALWRGVYTALGVDPDAVDLVAAYATQSATLSIGAWQTDDFTNACLSRLEASDPELAALLRSGAHTAGGRILAEYRDVPKPEAVVRCLQRRGIG